MKNRAYSRVIATLVAVSGLPVGAGAIMSPSVTYEMISLNQKKTVELNGVQTFEFRITLQDDLFYVVETTGSLPTHLSVKAEYQMTDMESGIGHNACIGFKGAKDMLVIIKLRGTSNGGVGPTILQIRKQQAVLYGQPANLLCATDQTIR